jgi:hypothetical protein
MIDVVKNAIAATKSSRLPKVKLNIGGDEEIIQGQNGDQRKDDRADEPGYQGQQHHGGRSIRPARPLVPNGT